MNAAGTGTLANQRDVAVSSAVNCEDTAWSLLNLDLRPEQIGDGRNEDRLRSIELALADMNSQREMFYVA